MVMMRDEYEDGRPRDRRTKAKLSEVGQGELKLV